MTELLYFVYYDQFEFNDKPLNTKNNSEQR